MEPWSRYLTGTPGKAPEPFYDPLQFWIDECHRQGLEFHAWLNPFRVAQNSNELLGGNHIAFQHPEWIVKYGNLLYFDPGLPQAREFVTRVVKDIVLRYDVDAIHFDDYFYPYPLAADYPDTVSFALYNRGFRKEDKADWRRENVDIIIKMLNDTIKATKPWVKFGISPFGVWRNKADDPRGSDTNAGATNYDHLYADVIKWQQNGWIDYLLPQIYWQIGHPQADFKLLANWWKDHAYNRGMYIGHAVYKIEAGSATPAWTRPGEIPNQIRMLRKTPGIEGSAFYSAKHFNRDLFGLQDSLRNSLYRKPAIVPPMKWIDNTPPQPVKKISKRGKKVKWKTENAELVTDKPNLFVVYGNESGTFFDAGNNNFFWGIVKETELKFAPFNSKKKKYEVRISVLDRLNNESTPSKPVKVKL
ncbi:MAG: hypothetical protein FD181_526 [Prolixibacteraceae bacterium]|nr:MAG: hypothetical protein FD181_526 [Prolixibacteraceae bacterium]